MWCPALQPCSPAHPLTPHGQSNMVCLMQRETSIIRAEAETTAQNTNGRGRADVGYNGLCCRLATLIQPQWQFDGCTWDGMGLYLRVYMHVDIISMVFTHSPLMLFFLYSEGGFSCGKLLRKKQLRIPKQYTTMVDIICAMCVLCP